MVRQLQVVRLSADGRELLLGPTRDGRPTHGIAADDRLARALRGEDPDADRPGASPISPRDIQARLRAGATVEEVAAEAGVPVGRVERFAGPVRSELEQVIGAAAQAVLRRPRAGESAVPLGDAVATNLGLTNGARPETVVWQAARAADGCWQVSVRVEVRGRSRLARWRFRVGDREVVAMDAYATALGFVDAARPSRPAAETTPPPARKTPTRKTSATKTSATKTSATKTAAPAAPRPTAATSRPRPGRGR